MPSPTDLETFRPRRDGLFERRGTWSEATVGSKILGPSGRRTDVWEVTASAIGDEPAEPGFTLWLKVASVETGEEIPLAPRWGGGPVTFVCESPDDPNPLPAPSIASNAEKVRLLVESLGATVLATRSNASGEVTCPNYSMGESIGDDSYGREFGEHLRMFHNLDPAGMEAKDRINAHLRAHKDGPGIPHRHEPEGVEL